MVCGFDGSRLVACPFVSIAHTHARAQNAGALPKNASDWFERASRARRKAKEHKYAFSGPRVDNKWHLATYAREKEADESDDANNQTARRRAAYNATADEELWAWFTKGGGKMSFVEPVTQDSADPVFADQKR